MLLRTLSAQILSVVRRWPIIHWPVHQAARLIIKTGWGEKYVREVLGPNAQTDADYRDWILAHDTLSDGDRTAIINGADDARFEQHDQLNLVATRCLPPEQPADKGN